MTSRPATTAPILAVVAALVLLPTLYILSIGPAHASPFVSPEAFRVVYYPVLTISARAELDNWLVSYLEWWDTLVGNSPFKERP